MTIVTLFISAELNAPVTVFIASCGVCFLPVLIDFTESVPLLQKLQEVCPIFMLHMNGVFTTVKTYMGIRQPVIMLVFNLCLICLFYLLIKDTAKKHQVTFTTCGQTVVLYDGELAAVLSLLPEQAQEEIFQYYFQLRTQKEIGERYGQTRITAGRHIQLALQQLQLLSTRRQLLRQRQMHYMPALWFYQKERYTFHGEGWLVNFADDFIACFQEQK